MVIEQEVYYITTGRIRQRKAIKLVYTAGTGGVEVRGWFTEGGSSKRRPYAPSEVAYLPSLEVTPREFKGLTKRYEEIF